MNIEWPFNLSMGRGNLICVFFGGGFLYPLRRLLGGRDLAGGGVAGDRKTELLAVVIAVAIAVRMHDVLHRGGGFDLAAGDVTPPPERKKDQKAPINLATKT